jgi:hypothetical protein
MTHDSIRRQIITISFVLLLAFPVQIVFGKGSGFVFCPPEEVEDVVSEMQHEAGEEELPFDALEMDVKSREPLFLTGKAARDDVERLFYLLENGYSGYGYFEQAGDFQVAKENILSDLDGKVILRGSELSGIIHEHLGFLHDCHLSIGDHGYGEHHDFWFDEEYELEKDDQGYFIEHDGEARAIISINGEDPDGFVFLSLSPDGDEIFHLGLLSPQPPDPLEVVLSDLEEPIQVELVTSGHEYGKLFSDTVVGGVPVVRIGSFSDHHKEYIDQFLASASKYKDEPCLIVDIRGNGGGNTMYARQWVTSSTGVNPGSIQVFTELVSETSMMGRANYLSYLLDNYPDLEDQGYPQKIDRFMGTAEQIETGESEAHWSPYNVPTAKEIPSNRTLIVLIDSNVGSAAEGFLCYLQQMDNVVLVGENSGGAVIYGQMTMHLLPNSRLQVRLPITLNIFTDLVYREERGFYPDYWVPAGEAVNYAVAAVRSGIIPTTESYVDQVSSVKFVHQISPKKSIGVLDVFPYVLFLFYGGVFVVVNRKRDWKFFLVCSVLGAFVWLYISVRNPSLKPVFLLAWVEYLLIALYKRWKDLTN